MVGRLGLGKNNHLTYASLALNPRSVAVMELESAVLTGMDIASCDGSLLLTENLPRGWALL